MGYNIFARLAITSSDTKELEQISKSLKFPLLERVTWYNSQKHIVKLSSKFPNLIFVLLFTGESNELEYIIFNNGQAMNYIDFGDIIGKDLEFQKVLKNIEEDENGDENGDDTSHLMEEYCEKALVNKIKAMNLTDISELFQDLNDEFPDNLPKEFNNL